MASLVHLSRKCLSQATSQIKNVVIIGSGSVGSGIAEVAAQTQHQVVLVDQCQDALERSKKKIEFDLGKAAKKLMSADPEVNMFSMEMDTQGKEMIKESLDRITFTTDMIEALKSADLVMETIFEDIKAKQHLLYEVDQLAPSHALFTTNTSGLSVADIMNSVKRKHKTGGLHFFSPVSRMRLVEIIRVEETSEETFKCLVDFVERMGKTPIPCKDTPGFVVNRLLVPYVLEAIRMLERGDATVTNIDQAMRLGANYPKGPFELADHLGLDTLKQIQVDWASRFPDNLHFAPVPYLNRMVAQGKLGVKSGEGFYTYNKSPPTSPPVAIK